MSDLARATEKLTRHAYPITLEPLEPMEDEKVLSREEARALLDELQAVSDADWTYNEEPFHGGLHIGPCPECAKLQAELQQAREKITVLSDALDYLHGHDATQAALELQQAREALAWYDDHKREDGSYDGDLFGDLSALGRGKA